MWTPKIAAFTVGKSQNSAGASVVYEQPNEQQVLFFGLVCLLAVRQLRVGASLRLPYSCEPPFKGEDTCRGTNSMTQQTLLLGCQALWGGHTSHGGRFRCYAQLRAFKKAPGEITFAYKPGRRLAP